MAMWEGKQSHVKWLKFIACLFFLYHALAVITMSYMPRDLPLASWLQTPFRPYIWATGMAQNWTMFHTWDTNQKLTPTILARSHAGEVREFGALLPGLRKGNDRLDLRLHVFFQRLASKKKDARLDAYFQNVCQAIRRSQSFDVEAIRLVVKYWKINPVQEILSGGELSTIKERKLSKFSCS